ncbi:MAG: hypothetical protein J2P31_17180, partial [Blastocatellia bacterium]|nr:hypothetical protein [Blastocatellia bacterium]
MTQKHDTNRFQIESALSTALFISLLLCASPGAQGQTAQSGQTGQPGQRTTSSRQARKYFQKKAKPATKQPMRMRSATSLAPTSAPAFHLTDKSFRIIVPPLGGVKLEGFYDYSYRVNLPMDMYLEASLDPGRPMLSP